MAGDDLNRNCPRNLRSLRHGLNNWIFEPWSDSNHLWQILGGLSFIPSNGEAKDKRKSGMLINQHSALISKVMTHF